MNSSHVHHRRSLRLQGYDYSQAGAYFVTVCTRNRSCLFGSVSDNAAQAHEAAAMVLEVWDSLPARFPDLELDAFVVMPNHIHGILVLPDREHGAVPLGTIAGAFKSLTTLAYSRGVRESGWRPFSHALWQRNYYEHVIRSEQALERVRAYIESNPLRWLDDPENPERQV